MLSLKGVITIAKTYKVSGYVVDPNGDDFNRLDIPYLLETYGDVSIMRLSVTESPTWEFEDDCPENHGPLTDEMCERRFKVGESN